MLHARRRSFERSGDLFIFFLSRVHSCTIRRISLFPMTNKSRYGRISLRGRLAQRERRCLTSIGSGVQIPHRPPFERTMAAHLSSHFFLHCLKPRYQFRFNAFICIAVHHKLQHNLQHKPHQGSHHTATRMQHELGVAVHPLQFSALALPRCLFATRETGASFQRQSAEYDPTPDLSLRAAPFCSPPECNAFLLPFFRYHCPKLTPKEARHAKRRTKTRARG